jgi:hypothetical protein
MAGFRGKVLLAGVLLLATATSAQAWWGWRWSGYGPGYYAYYGPAYYQPVYYYPVNPVCVPMMPMAPTMPPARALGDKIPAGTSKEPPVLGDTKKKGPIITESRSQSAAYAGGDSRERCKVGFWNLTGRDVTLKVDGQERVLPKNRAITLTLERSFAWQIDQGDSVSEHVPEGQPFHEVVLRR